MTEVAKKGERNMQIGMIGVGRMGGSMALRLIRGGLWTLFRPLGGVEDTVVVRKEGPVILTHYHRQLAK